MYIYIIFLYGVQFEGYITSAKKFHQHGSDEAACSHNNSTAFHLSKWQQLSCTVWLTNVTQLWLNTMGILVLDENAKVHPLACDEELDREVTLS